MGFAGKAPTFEELPPHDPEAEAGALACVLLAGEARQPGEAERIMDELSLDHFYEQRHRIVFQALRCLRADLKPLTIVSLWQRLKDQGQVDEAGGMGYVLELPQQTPSFHNFATYYGTLHDRAIRRAALRDAAELALHARDLTLPTTTVAEASRRLLQGYASGGVNAWEDLVEDAASVMVQEIAAPIEVVGGIVTERSKFVIGSGSKCFKTWLSLSMGLAISCGKPFLGRSTSRGRVLYVNLELKADTFARRLQAVARAMGVEVESDWFVYLSLRGKLSNLSPHEIISRVIHIARRRKCKVVFIDPIYKLSTDGDENNSRDITALFNDIDRLTTEANCAVILNDHSGKGNQAEKDPLDVLRGSSAKGGDVDAALILRRHEVAGCFRVDVIHRELPPVEPFVLGWNYPLMEVRQDLSPEDMRRVKGGRRRDHDPLDLIAAISDRDTTNPITVSEWAERLGVKRQTLHGYLPGMRRSGWIATVGEGRQARIYVTAVGRETVSRA